jgi:exopolysaccharide production protein ExoY
MGKADVVELAPLPENECHFELEKKRSRLRVWDMLDIAGSVRLPARPRVSDDRLLRSVLGGIWKRAFDIAISGIAVIVLTPILIATAGLIRLLLGRQVVVAEERIGHRGRPFACYAFRVMPLDYGPSLDQDEGGRPVAKSWPGILGQALRASGLEKLPRLFNVLRGDMSLIGPRPIATNEILRYQLQAPEYFSARPGLTGIWRHVDRRRVGATPRPRLAIDRYYVRRWSLRLDLALLLKAIVANPPQSDFGGEGSVRNLTVARRNLA